MSRVGPCDLVEDLIRLHRGDRSIPPGEPINQCLRRCRSRRAASQLGEAKVGHRDAKVFREALLTEHFVAQFLAQLHQERFRIDSIQPSTRHASGLALRFPRIKAIRRDKTVDAIDTLTYAKQLVGERLHAAPTPETKRWT